MKFISLDDPNVLCVKIHNATDEYDSTTRYRLENDSFDKALGDLDQH